MHFNAHKSQIHFVLQELWKLQSNQFLWRGVRCWIKNEATNVETTGLLNVWHHYHCYKLPSAVLCRNLLVRQWMICSSYGDYLVWWNPIRCFGTIRGLEQSEHHADIPVQHLSHFVLMFPYYCSANCNIPHCICFRHRTAMLPLPLVWLVSWLGVTLAIATLAVIYIMICRYWSPIMYDQSIVNVIRS